MKLSITPLLATLLSLAFSLSLIAAIVWIGDYHSLPSIKPKFTPSVIGVRQYHNPFALDGCLLMGQESIEQNGGCFSSFALKNFPPNAELLYQQINQYRQVSTGVLPNEVIFENNNKNVMFRQGRHVQLGIKDKEQSIAQVTAQCYVGVKEACQKCPWCVLDDAELMYEGAKARSMGILVVDVQSGVIEGAGSAYSSCYEKFNRGEPYTKDCPHLPSLPKKRIQAFDNLALFDTAKPGSINKIIIIAGLLQAGLNEQERASLVDIIKRSDTKKLISIVMCKRQSYEPSCIRKRLQSIREASINMGWRGRSDLLVGNEYHQTTDEINNHQFTSVPVFSGRLFSDYEKHPFPLLKQKEVSECGDLKEPWRGCKGQALNKILAELYGTGDAESSAMGGASLLRFLAMNGKSSQIRLIKTAQNNSGQWEVFDQQISSANKNVEPKKFEKIMDGLAATSELDGTAYFACLLVAKQHKNGLLPCINHSDVKFYGKTGTPVFSGDDMKGKKTLIRWQQECEHYRQQLEVVVKGSALAIKLKNELGKCNMRPIKWFGVLVKSTNQNFPSKIIVAITERNWSRKTQLIDSPADKGANVSALAALGVASALISERN